MAIGLEPRAGLAVERPDGIGHRVVVRVHEVVAVVRMAGEVELPDAMRRHLAQVIERLEAVVHGAHVDIVQVEQQQAVGKAPQTMHLKAHELRLGTDRIRELRT